MAWEERIKTAIKAKGFTHEDMNASGSWQSCAVSENPNIIRDDDFCLGHVKGARRYTRSLGMKFMEAVKKNHYRKAMALYQKIKARVQ